MRRAQPKYLPHSRDLVRDRWAIVEWRRRRAGRSAGRANRRGWSPVLSVVRLRRPPTKQTLPLVMQNWFNQLNRHVVGQKSPPRRQHRRRSVSVRLDQPGLVQLFRRRRRWHAG